MDDTLLVRRVEGVCNLSSVVQRLIASESGRCRRVRGRAAPVETSSTRILTSDPVRQRLTVDKLEDDAAYGRGSCAAGDVELLESVDCRDVGMIQRCQRPRLALESREPVHVLGEGGREYLMAT